MKPILFKANETKFDTYGLGEINATKAIVTRERNGNYTLYMEYPAHGQMAKLFQREMKIKADSGVRTKNQTFEISRINRNSRNLIKIYAKHISHKTELMGLNPSVSVVQVSAMDALQVWSANTVGGIKFDTWSDITTLNSTSWTIDKVENARQALGGVAGSILDVWGGEYEFDNTLIRLHKQLGRKAPTVLEYGRNILSAEEDEDIEGTYTSIYPFATYTPEGSSAESIVVTLDERYLDSDHVNAYANRRIKIVDLSSKFGEKEVPTQEKLRTTAKSYMKANNVGVPDINTKVKYVDLASTLDYQSLSVVEEIELCDIVPIYYPSLGITNHEGKVVVVEYNVLLDRNESIEIGSIGKGIGSAITSSISSRIETLEKNQQTINETIIPYLVNSRGNRIWYVTPDPNVEHKVGDLWFEKNGIYERMYIWNGEEWHREIDTEKFYKDMQEKFEEVDKKADRLKEEVDSIDEKVAQVLEKAGANTELAEVAKGLADNALENAKNLQTTLSQYNKDLMGFKREAEATDESILERLIAIDGDTGKLNELKRTADKTIEMLGAVNEGETLSSMITKSAGEMLQQITSVKHAIPTTSGTQNILRGTKDMRTENGQWASGGRYQSGNAGKIETIDLTDSPIPWVTKGMQITKNATKNEIGFAQSQYPILRKGKIFYSIWIKGQIGTKLMLQPWWSQAHPTVPRFSLTIEKEGWVEYFIFADNEHEEKKNIGYIYIDRNEPEGTVIEVCCQMLAYSHLKVPYALALEDTVTTKEFHTVRDSFKLHERVIGTTESAIKANLSRLVMSDSLFQTEIRRAVGTENYVYNGNFNHGFNEWKYESYPNGITIDVNNHSQKFNKNGVHVFGKNTSSIDFVGFAQEVKFNLKTHDPISLAFDVASEGVHGHIYCIVHYRKDGEIKSQTSFKLDTYNYSGKFTRYTHNLTAFSDTDTVKIMFYAQRNQQVNWYITDVSLKKGANNFDFVDSMVGSKFTQLADNLSLGLFNRAGLISGVQAVPNGVYIKGSLIYLDGTVNMTEAFVHKLMVDTASINTLTALTARIGSLTAIGIDVNKLTGNRAQLISAGFNAINGSLQLDGSGIVARDNRGNLAKITGLPEFKTMGADHTSISMTEGRIHFTWFGGDVFTIGNNVVQGGSGVLLAKNAWFNMMQRSDVTASNDEYYTVNQGESAVWLLENKFKHFNGSKWHESAAEFKRINGWGYAWPVLQPGDRVKIKEGDHTIISKDGVRYVFHTQTPNGQHNGLVAFGYKVVTSGGLDQTSDRRLKYEIEPTRVEALSAIQALMFKSYRMKESKEYIPIGLIAQEAGILRVQGEIESVNLTQAIMLSLKGVQELMDKIAYLEQKIKELS